MRVYELTARLRGLQSSLAQELKDPRSLYFDPAEVLEFFQRYAPLRDGLRSAAPGLLGDVPSRPTPVPRDPQNYEGRGCIDRQSLDLLLRDMDYILNVLAATPAVEVPSMKITREGVFFAGQYFDALRKVAGLVNEAKASVWLVDGYIGAETLDLLAGRAADVAAWILTKDLQPQTRTLAEAFKKQHDNLEIRSCQAFHDRFLIIDDRDCYHFGASIKDLGRRGFMFSVIEEPDVESSVRQKFQQEWGAATVLI